MRSPSLSRKNVSSTVISRPVMISPRITAPLWTPRASGPPFSRRRAMPSSTFSRISLSLRLNGGSASTSVALRRPSSARGRSSPNWSPIDGATAAPIATISRKAPSIAPAAASASGTPRPFSQRTIGSSSVLASSATMIGSTTTRR